MYTARIVYKLLVYIHYTIYLAGQPKFHNGKTIIQKIFEENIKDLLFNVFRQSLIAELCAALFPQCHCGSLCVTNTLTVCHSTGTNRAPVGVPAVKASMIFFYGRKAGFRAFTRQAYNS